MSRGQAQMVMVTKERKRTGAAGTGLNIVLTIFTGGLWLVVPLMQWMLHAVGPRKKSRTVIYGAPQQQYYPAPYQPQYYAPPAPAPYGYDQYGRPLPGPTRGRIYGPPLPPGQPPVPQQLPYQ